MKTNITIKKNGDIIEHFNNSLDSFLNDNIGLIVKGVLPKDFVGLTDFFDEYNLDSSGSQYDRDGIGYKREGDLTLYSMKMLSSSIYTNPRYVEFNGFFVSEEDIIINEVNIGVGLRSEGFNVPVAKAVKNISINKNQRYELEWRIYANG